MMLLSEVVETNPGPTEKFTCSTCLNNPEESTKHVQSADPCGLED